MADKTPKRPPKPKKPKKPKAWPPRYGVESAVSPCTGGIWPCARPGNRRSPAGSRPGCSSRTVRSARSARGSAGRRAAGPPGSGDGPGWVAAAPTDQVIPGAQHGELCARRSRDPPRRRRPFPRQHVHHRIELGFAGRSRRCARGARLTWA